MKKFTLALVLLSLTACGTATPAEQFTGHWQGVQGSRSVNLQLVNAGGTLSGQAQLNFDLYGHGRDLTVTGQVTGSRVSLNLLDTSGQAGYTMTCQQPAGGRALDCTLSAVSGVQAAGEGVGSSMSVLAFTLQPAQ